MTVYSYFLVSGSGPEPDFEATGHDGDDRALSYAETLFDRDPDIRIVEVWDGPLRLAHLRRERLRRERPSWERLSWDELLSR